MKTTRPIHSDFLYYLDFKDRQLIELFKDLRAFVLELHPDSNELLYHTHALTSLFTISEKMSDSFCMIPIYTNHLNLGFSKGTLLSDPHNLLQGTGKFIRHIPVRAVEDYRNDQVIALMQSAIDFAIEDMDKPTKTLAKTISKIKIKQ